MIASGGCQSCGSDPVDQFDRLPKFRLVYPDGSAQTAFTQADVAAKVAAFAPYGDVEVLELVSERGAPVKYDKPAPVVPRKPRAKIEDENTLAPDGV